MEPHTGLTSGTVLEGRYRVGAVIARGGMSTVYRGIDTRLDRPVAIKVMSPQYVSDVAFLTRFEREARLAASLRHPGVVAVYDQGRDGDLVYLVMELVDGGTLRDLLREQRSLSVPVTLSVLEPLLAALGAAHAAGLVHRDVKPENVLISARGEVKIADFGLVRAVTSQTMATGDVILGTVAYLSPEQVATGASDARSDVYATGIMAYEMLTGEPPFAGETPMSVAYRHVHSDVPHPAAKALGTPEALDELIVAATRRDPAARPRDASAFLAALVGVRSQLGLRRVPVPVPHRRPVLAGAAAPAHAASAPPAGAAPGGTRVFGPPSAPPSADPALPSRTQPAPPSEQHAPGPSRPAHGQPTHGQPTQAQPTQAQPTQAQPTQTYQTRGAPRVTTAAARRRRRWLIAILVIVLLGVGAAAGGWWLGGRWAAAPAAVGLSQAQAEAAVRDAGLVPRIRTGHQDTVPRGVVASIDPEAGSRLLRGSEVDLLVSSGRPQVPKIAAGTTPDAAKAAVKAADLTAVVAAAPAFDDTVAAGAVLRTTPAAGTPLPVGGAVTLVLSAGPAPLAVPDVTGKSAEDAENKLLATGFTVGPRKRIFDPQAQPGSVLGSTPAAGTTATKGSEVSLRVADALTVPDVRGSATDDAVATMERAGFTVTVGDPAFDADINAGDILRTDPGPGALVDPENAQVFLVPSNAVSVPDVTGGTVQQATDRLAALGLSASVLGLFGAADSTVWDQSPGAGGRVEPGGTVRVSAFP